MPRHDRPGRILVVDDMESMCRLMEALLSDRGHEVRTATTGAAALEIVRSFDCDVAIVDYRLLDADGLDLIGELRALRPRLKAILMTSYGDPGLQERLAEQGLSGYMAKPFNNAKMIESVERLVAEATAT
jgi:DNA-binding NtrC family response regulator